MCDNYFAATLGPTFLNRFFAHRGRTDRVTNTLEISTAHHLGTGSSDAGLGGHFSDAPASALLGLRHLFITRTVEQFKQDAAAGRFPNVSSVDPRFLIPTPFGTSADYHPVSDIRAGALSTRSRGGHPPQLGVTVLVVNLTRGGLYDHVVPGPKGPGMPIPTRPSWVPCPVSGQCHQLAKRGPRRPRPYDHTSVLKMIEWAWDPPPLALGGDGGQQPGRTLDRAGPPDPDVHRWSCLSSRSRTARPPGWTRDLATGWSPAPRPRASRLSRSA